VCRAFAETIHPFLNFCTAQVHPFMSSLTSLQVRHATQRDAAHIAALYAATAQEAFKSMRTGSAVPPVPQAKDAEYWRDAIEFAEPQVQVAVDGDKIVGFVGYDRSRDTGTPNTMGEIWDIYAAADYWSQGVGLALWDAAREGLQEEGCTHVSIWVPIANDRAMRFHELAGFKREMSSAKTVPMGPVKVEEIRLKQAL
jgi:ribosomal protein S18 acetylase RimI-like enzyme